MSDFFYIVDKDCSGYIDFENLLDFFKRLGFFPYEEEIIYILRRIDGDDDGRLTLLDLENLFQHFSLENEQNDIPRSNNIAPNNNNNINQRFIIYENNNI